MSSLWLTNQDIWRQRRSAALRTAAGRSQRPSWALVGRGSDARRCVVGRHQVSAWQLPLLGMTVMAVGELRVGPRVLVEVAYCTVRRICEYGRSGDEVDARYLTELLLFTCAACEEDVCGGRRSTSHLYQRSTFNSIMYFRNKLFGPRPMLFPGTNIIAQALKLQASATRSIFWRSNIYSGHIQYSY